MKQHHKIQATIFALSTVMGKSGVAVIRIAGSDSIKVPPLLGYKKILQPKKATYTPIYTLDKQEVLDDVLLIFFQSPYSFNGEDIIEIHSHGSLAVIKDILYELSKIEFLRPAEPGEFTKTAFKNGKIDLVKAEALADLLDAETSMQKKLIQKQLNGELSSIYQSWRQSLVLVLSQLEAFIDFPDDDIPKSALIEAQRIVNQLQNEISSHLLTGKNVKCIMDGIKIVISGSPNAGKSSLINLLAQQEIAIVSEIPGTTRDLLQVKLDINGFAVVLYDTAGLRDTTDSIEKEGIRKAKAAVEEADFNVIVINNLEEFMHHSQSVHNKQVIWLLNKIDLLSKIQLQYFENEILNHIKLLSKKDLLIAISIKSSQGIDCFIETLGSLIKTNYQGFILEPTSIKLRQKKILQECLYNLQQFSFNKTLEITTEDIRAASDAIGMLTGKICVEEILDEVFANFCIGK